METLVSVGIFIALMGLILANYHRGNDDSVLSREALLLTSRLRLAQEQTAGGQVTGFCKVQNRDTFCTTLADCPSGGTECTQTTPSGGYGMFFSCETGTSYGDNHWPSRGSYFLFGDRVQCQKNCFPFEQAFAANFAAMDTGTDHLFSSDKGASYNKGDTLAAEYAFDPKVTLQDIQLLEAGTTGKVECANGSPWKGTSLTMPGGLDSVPNPYPLQAAIHFPTPDGRTTVLSDNVSTKTPAVAGLNLTGNKQWKEVDLMLALKTRPTLDCRMVRITYTGVVTQAIDADCQF